MKILGILGAVAGLILSVVLVVHYNQTSQKAVDQLDQERYERMVAQEEVEGLRSKVESLQIQLSRTSDKLKSLEVINKQTSDLNSDLKERLKRAEENRVNLEASVDELKKSVSPPAGS